MFSKIENKGITLVALVITIVVLVILATITIQEVNGNGILGKAQEAAKQTERAEIIEKGKLELMYVQIDQTISTEGFENLMKSYDIDGKIKNDARKRYIETQKGNVIYLSEINGEGLIPDEYQEVKYLRGNGAQYIDTGYKWVSDDIEVEIKKFNPRYSMCDGQYVTRFGFYDGSNYGLNIINQSSYANLVTCTNLWGNSFSVKFSSNVFVDFKLYYINGVFGYDIDGITQNTRNINISISKTLTSFIFARNNQGIADSFCSSGTGDIGELIMKDNGTIVRDFIPCYRKSDDVAGMYDLVNGVFYTNAGTGTFIVGPDIN